MANQETVVGRGFDPDTTLGAYAQQWLNLKKGRVGELTWRKIEIDVRKHLAPLASRRVLDLDRRELKKFFAGLAAEGKLAPATIAKVISALHGILEEAVDDGAFAANPATRLAHHLRPSSRSTE